MEDLLLQIVKEASGSKFQHIKQAAQIAHGMLKWRTFFSFPFGFFSSAWQRCQQKS
jgi:hypothetical protein